MRLFKPVYNILRSMIMTLIVLLVIVYVGLYVVLSVPGVQNKIKSRASDEISNILGGRLEISSLTVRPFSEVLLSDVTLDSPEGERCASIRRVAAGIDIWSLLTDRRIVLNYAEVLGFRAEVEQQVKSGPLNIQFLIDALSPKDKDKPSALFDLRIRNVVVRDSKAVFRRLWMVDDAGEKMKFADIDINRLRMDLSIPVLRNEEFRFDIRNIQFDATPGLLVRGLSGEVAFLKASTPETSDRLLVKNFNIIFPNGYLKIGDTELRMDALSEIDAIVKGHLTPSDFSAFDSRLEKLDSGWDIDINATAKDNTVAIKEISLHHPESDSSISLIGELADLSKKDSLDISLKSFVLNLAPSVMSDAIGWIPKLSEKTERTIQAIGRITAEVKGELQSGEKGCAEGNVTTSVGSIEFSASGKGFHSKSPRISLTAKAEDVLLDRILATDRVGKVSAEIEAEFSGFDRHADGKIAMSSHELEALGNYFNGVEVQIDKVKDRIGLMLEAKASDASVNMNGIAVLAGRASHLDADMTVEGFSPSSFGVIGKMADSDISFRLNASVSGDSPDNVTGTLDLRDVAVKRIDGQSLNLSRLSVSVDSLFYDSESHLGGDSAFGRKVKASSDWLDADIEGIIRPSSLLEEMKSIVGSIMPSLLSGVTGWNMLPTAENDFNFNIKIKGTEAPYAFFGLPVRPLADIPISGSIDSPNGKGSLKVCTPHLQQGKNKLIRDVDFNLDVDALLGMARLDAGLIFPAKKGDAEMKANILAIHDKINMDLGINPTLESVVKGGISLVANVSRLPDPFNPHGQLAVMLDILPSTIVVNNKAWMVGEGAIDYSGKRISVRDFLVSHERQYVRIEGTASENPEDQVKVRLNDIDLEYIFNILNINYVSFGGMATGEVVGSRLLTKSPEARTDHLHVKRLSYNGALLGDADLASEYDLPSQRVGIYAVIRDSLTRQRRVSVDGGIWVTRDSLSFAFDADKVNVGIMKPFVSAFCSDLYGEASGKCKLFGNFSDIDLIGDLKADTLSMKLDFTNTWYHAGGDSVYLHKGVIDIPPLTLYDDDGHTAEFSGWLRHTYFHDPVFSFRLRDAQDLLCYNTNEKINPLWYGTIYGSGNAQINGRPGLIEIDMNMTTEEGSKFYYVISDTEDVAQNSFLTFTDKRKESIKAAEVDSVPDYLKRFRKHTQEMESGSSNVVLSIKGTVTNEALVTLVMDPRAGDNITARGQGALQMDYNLASNDLRMIGTYILDEGNYNFTLQDIIIKNFTIRQGSLIKFDGDPMRANLDITATYRVNTNLTDLDESFANDKDLNRTNVPVDAVLLVDGPMTNPDITFDIELPSLMSDVERKVKSIVSTNDMMSRQIIYLLALNRFYTPEYTGSQQNSGGEWSSLASSTISSQLSNMLSQITDKLDVAPSFRSDKGGFSDMEFDLALSSRLLNNRLLINGNFGYRDKNTSNTQFVGDFDIEYLLNKSGNLRLKAYNHFNDQNYYLRSALTTQGVGVVFKRDFDRLFRRKSKKESGEEDRDSIPSHSSPSMEKEREELPDSLQ